MVHSTSSSDSTLPTSPMLPILSWPDSLLWSIWTKGLILGSFFHLLLPDYQQNGWGIAWAGGLFCLLGLALIPSSCRLRTPRYQWSMWKNWSLYFPLFPLGFAFFKLQVLLFHRDVLTQSLLLLCFHLCCAYFLYM